MWWRYLCTGLLFCELASPKTAPKRGPEPIDPNVVNDPNVSGTLDKQSSASVLLRAQILLDRAGFSPGEIDAAYGSNTRRAVAAFLQARNASDTDLWTHLNSDVSPALITYSITDQDLAGPFAPVPADMMEKSKLPELGYASPIEAIGERFHSSPKLLERLNPGRSFATPGEQILVPNVITPLPPKAAKIVVDKSDLAVVALGDDGSVLAYYPASIGSEHDPLPVGTWKINGVGRNPKFHYNPKLFWDADPSHAKATIPPGPNNPVGVVWIDLSKDHYGIHGTPEPRTIGKTQSHGCIRLTNWDAAELAEIVAPKLPAILQE